MSMITVKHQPTILLLATEPFELLHDLVSQLEDIGCRCRCVSGSKQEISQAISVGDCCFALFAMGDNEGNDLPPSQVYRELLGNIPFACVCAHGTFEAAVAAMRTGACDVLQPPFDHSSLEYVANAAHTHYQERKQLERGACNGVQSQAVKLKAVSSTSHRNRSADSEVAVIDTRANGHAAHLHGSPLGEEAEDSAALAAEAEIVRQLESTLVGVSLGMDKIRRLIARVAPTEANVMIYGKSGTGKELVATAIHRFSGRSKGPFIPVNMAAIPPGLAESELFGHVKGAFTDASDNQEGYCQAADNGTLFLDEISKMEMGVQPKLLRFLQEGTLQRVGSHRGKRVDARIITATNSCPSEIVRDGALREDLYFRLHVVPIHIPCLRDRREDIEVLAELFLQRTAAKNDKPVVGFTPSAMRVLQSYDWPGNARQLENAIENMVILTRGRLIDANDTPWEYHLNVPPDDNDRTGLNGGVGSVALSDSQLTPIQRHERTAIIEALDRVDGHVVRAARLLGLGQATVYRKIQQYDIPRKRERRPRRPRRPR